MDRRSMNRIALANSDADLRRCFPVMHELRTHLDLESYLAQVKRQADTDRYQTAYLEEDGQVCAVAGFRLMETLAWGKIVYVDDLVTLATDRSKGYGDRLLDWLVEFARTHGCAQFHLDSGVQRHGAHRFYLRKRMDITAYHFAMKLGESGT